MLLVLVELNRLREIIHVSVDPHADKAASLRGIKDLLVAALAPADNRREQLDLLPLRKRHDLINHLIDALLPDLSPTVRAVRNTDPRVEKTHVVVNLSDSSHRRARVSVRRLLIDGDGRRKTLDALHIGLLHLAEELARVGRERLHVSPLPLRVDRVERKRTLARPGETGQDDELVPRDVDVEVLQIVFICASDLYIFLSIHSFLSFIVQQKLRQHHITHIDAALRQIPAAMSVSGHDPF